ncbi:hypothetical protein RND81_07G060700 [Saponaria officinalis]|uniref:Transposase n=1 Tax=Saponaria officinalis TaxID=3572 RepID=A0AAW1JMW4_SAPOF
MKCRCLFRIRSVENYHVQDNKRLVLWNIITADGFGCHNHQPTKYKDGHRHYTCLNEEEKAYVRQQYRAAVFPRYIKSDLHQKTPDKPQHSKIRKELEDSMSRPRITHRLFSLLQENVSIKAIEIMEDEVKRGVALGIGLELGCGCVLPTTHGLPCVCTLIDLKNSGSRVHLSDIHPFWRTLEYENEEAMPKNDNEMLEDLVDKARKSDLAYRKVFLEKLRDILHPEDEDILAPAVRENPKGRPRGSTTRNKSEFKHTLRKYGTPSPDEAINVQHLFGDFPSGAAGAPLEKNYSKGLISTWVKRFGVPEQLWSQFDGWVDVGSDGHCGFRVLSHALHGGEEDYI